MLAQQLRPAGGLGSLGLVDLLGSLLRSCACTAQSLPSPSGCDPIPKRRDPALAITDFGVEQTCPSCRLLSTPRSPTSLPGVTAGLWRLGRSTKLHVSGLPGSTRAHPRGLCRAGLGIRRLSFGRQGHGIVGRVGTRRAPLLEPSGDPPCLYVAEYSSVTFSDVRFGFMHFHATIRSPDVCLVRRRSEEPEALDDFASPRMACLTDSGRAAARQNP